MRRFINIIVLIAGLSSVFAQDRAELQERKKKLIEEIQLSNQVLKKTQQDKDLSLNQLKTLKQKISIRSQLIRTMQNEVGLINQEIVLNENHLKSLRNELDTLKVEYANLIQKSYKSSKHFNRLLFLFSAKDFKQAYKRAAYIRQIAQYRKLQAKAIVQKQNEIQVSVLLLEKQRKIKENIIQDKREENNALNQEQTLQSMSLARLSEKEKELNKSLEEKIIQRKKIQKEIERIIAEELKKVSKNPNANLFATTPEAIALSNSFTSNKGKLPWPVAKGLIISKYGKQKHPVLSGVTIENNGIEIATESHSACRAIFDGVVSSILQMPNGTKVLMVRHGEYISVYSNLSDSYVDKGDQVSTKQAIGLVFTPTNEEGTVLDFQLWKGAQKLNPQSWIMSK